MRCPVMFRGLISWAPNEATYGGYLYIPEELLHISSSTSPGENDED